jgi:hypothetical protein
MRTRGFEFYFLQRTIGTIGTMNFGFCFFRGTIGTMNLSFIFYRGLWDSGDNEFEDIIFFPVFEAIHIFNFIFTQYLRGYAIRQGDNDIKVYPFVFMMSQTKNNVLL